MLLVIEQFLNGLQFGLLLFQFVFELPFRDCCGCSDHFLTGRRQQRRSDPYK